MDAKEDDNGDIDQADALVWTTSNVILTVALFVATGVAEIGGGWLVWQTVKENKPVWWAVVGSLILVVYGFLPTLQPVDAFGRVYAVYGGFFIMGSFLASWMLDGIRPDRGDWVGGIIALAGVLVILFWPR